MFRPFLSILRLSPVAGTEPASAIVFSTPAAQVALVGTAPAAELWIFDGATRVWRSTGKAVTIDATGRTTEWIRLTTREDYATKTWDLYLNGKMVVADTTFADTSAASLTDFSVNGHATVASAFDEFYAGAENPLFADTNHDGLDDAWETAHGLSLNDDNRYGDPDGDGKNNVQEFTNDTDPKDYYNGQAPVITIISGNNQTAAPGQLNARPLVIRVTKTGGQTMVNAPVVFTVLSRDGLVATGVTGTPPPATTLSLRTDAGGMGQVFYQQPSAAGTASQIRAMAKDSYVDFNAQSSNQEDNDENGLPDEWEINNFGSTGVDPTADPDGDSRTNRQEYLAGTNPNDFFNGSTPVVTLISGNNQKAAPNQFNAAPFVVLVQNSVGDVLVNAPVSFEVTSGYGQLAVTPTTDEPSGRVSVATGSDGLAKIYYQQPSSIGANSKIEASVGRIKLTFYTMSVSSTPPPDTPPPEVTDPTDEDGNGLPDAWESKYFGHNGIDPNSDPDGDGYTNLQERANGTDPKDPLNGLSLLVIPLLSPLNELQPDNILKVWVGRADGTPLPNTTFLATMSSESDCFTVNSGGYYNSVWMTTDANGIATISVVAKPSDDDGSTQNGPICNEEPRECADYDHPSPCCWRY